MAYQYKAGEVGIVQKLNAIQDYNQAFTSALNYLTSGALSQDGLQLWNSERKPKAVGGGGKPKTVCPLTADEFTAQAGAIIVDIAGVPFSADAKLFSTGSFGWNVNGKLDRTIGGKVVKFQVSLNITAIGSKPADAKA